MGGGGGGVGREGVGKRKGRGGTPRERQRPVVCRRRPRRRRRCCCLPRRRRRCCCRRCRHRRGSLAVGGDPPPPPGQSAPTHTPTAFPTSADQSGGPVLTRYVRHRVKAVAAAVAARQGRKGGIGQGEGGGGEPVGGEGAEWRGGRGGGVAAAPRRTSWPAGRAQGGATAWGCRAANLRRARGSARLVAKESSCAADHVGHQKLRCKYVIQYCTQLCTAPFPFSSLSLMKLNVCDVAILFSTCGTFRMKCIVSRHPTPRYAMTLKTVPETNDAKLRQNR